MPAGNEFACARRSKRTGVTWSAGICAGVAASTTNAGGSSGIRWARVTSLPVTAPLTAIDAGRSVEVSITAPTRSPFVGVCNRLSDEKLPSTSSSAWTM